MRDSSADRWAYWAQTQLGIGYTCVASYDRNFYNREVSKVTVLKGCRPFADIYDIRLLKWLVAALAPTKRQP